MGEKNQDRLSHCEILGVTERATKAEIKFAFFRASEAYQYLIEHEFEEPLLEYKPFQGVNLITKASPRDRKIKAVVGVTFLSILTTALFFSRAPIEASAVPSDDPTAAKFWFAAERFYDSGDYSGCVHQLSLLRYYNPQSAEVTEPLFKRCLSGTPDQAHESYPKTGELKAMAGNFYLNKKFGDCVYEISLLRNYDPKAAHEVDSLDDRCVKGMIEQGLEATAGPAQRAPASLVPQSIDLDPTRMSDEEFMKAACSGQLFRRFERIYSFPELPEVKVIKDFQGISQGIAALSRQLRGQMHRTTDAAGKVGRDLQAFCKLQYGK